MSLLLRFSPQNGPILPFQARYFVYMFINLICVLQINIQNDQMQHYQLLSNDNYIKRFLGINKYSSILKNSRSYLKLS